MSDRHDLENALLDVERAARDVDDVTQEDETPLSSRVGDALARMHKTLAALDGLRATIRERRATA